MKAIDITGQKYGALTVLRLAPRDQWKYNRRTWVCKCDCGQTCLVEMSCLRRGAVKSCGCRSCPPTNDFAPRKCTVCGAEYAPTAYNQQRCAACARARRMRCAFCDKIYIASKYNRPGNRSRCPDCLAQLRGDINRGKARPQSDAARAKAHDARGAVGSVYIRAALDAGKTHPRTATGSHQHAHAKIWFLRSPQGVGFEVQNLNAFVNEHPDYFPNVKSAIQVFHVMGRTLRDPDGHFSHCYDYYGWTMDAPPVFPDDVQAAREYRQRKEEKRKKLRDERAPGYAPDETSEIQSDQNDIEEIL